MRTVPRLWLLFLLQTALSAFLTTAYKLLEKPVCAWWLLNAIYGQIPSRGIKFLPHSWEFIRCLRGGLPRLMSILIFSFSHRYIALTGSMFVYLPENILL